MTPRGIAWGLAGAVLSAVVVPVSVSAQSVVVVTFGLDPAVVVEDLPTHAADWGSEARAERAVEVSTFRVSVRPDDSTSKRVGCNQVFDFDLKGGDEGEVERSLAGMPSGSSCRFRVTITGAPAPFVIVGAGETTFDTADAGRGGALEVDLSGLVRLPWGRIAIIQDVTGSNDRGHVAYRVDRFCGSVVTSHDSLPGGRTVAPLVEGRFTVHSSDYANFGAGASYLAVALSTTSDKVVGCSVTVSVIDPPATCTVAPSTTQTSTWRSIGSIEHFDFEFDFACEGDGTDGGAPPTITRGIDTTTMTVPESATATVRVAARLRGDGRVEFALQQRGTAGGWADRRLPARRFFPADTAVGSWLVSSLLTLQGADGETVVRVVARLLGDGRVEFALQRRGDGGRWSDGLLPARRFFPADTAVGSWLVSSPLILLNARRGTPTRARPPVRA